MRRIPSFLLVAVCAAGLAGCDNPPKTNATAASQTQGPVPSPNNAQTAPQPIVGEQPVYTVSSVIISRPEPGSKDVVVRATGSARSGGWTEPKLEPVPGDAPDARSYRFVATAPGGPATSAITDIEVEARISNLPDSVKTIRVIGESNAIAAPVL